MTTSSAVPQPASSAPIAARPLLFWVFRQNRSAITSEIAVNASGRCEVRVIPQWNPSLGTCEQFGHVAEAMRRHAEIAGALRDIGWTVVEHVPVQALAA